MKNFNRKCDADADADAHVNVNAHDRGDNNSSVHFVLKMKKIQLLFFGNIHSENMFAKCIPTIPHFYLLNMGLTRIYLFLLFLIQNIDCGYSLERPPRSGSNINPQFTF